MTRLLIAFDGSDRAAEAVLAAARLFPGAEAIVLSVANDPWDLDPVPVTTLTLAGRAIPPARRSGTSTARGIAQRGCDLAQDAGLDAEPVSLPGGRAAVQICRAARRHDVDAIACGTHGHSSPRRGVAGSTAIAVMHQAGQPVLVVPLDAPAGDRDRGCRLRRLRREPRRRSHRAAPLRGPPGGRRPRRCRFRDRERGRRARS
jgi:nucleotide-binding universal stress UspA family protein